LPTSRGGPRDQVRALHWRCRAGVSKHPCPHCCGTAPAGRAPRRRSGGGGTPSTT